MNVINLTPHPIVVRMQDGSDVVYPTSGIVARVSEKQMQASRDNLNGIPLVGKSVLDKVIDLPDRVDGTIYLVSGMVAQNVSREDVYSPATGPNDGAIRNDKGHIIAVTKLKETV